MSKSRKVTRSSPGKWKKKRQDTEIRRNKAFKEREWFSAGGRGDAQDGRNDKGEMVAVVLKMMMMAVVMVMIVKGLITRCNGSASKYETGEKGLRCGDAGLEPHSNPVKKWGRRVVAWEDMERKEFKRDLEMKTIFPGICRTKFVTKRTGVERKIYLKC